MTLNWLSTLVLIAVVAPWSQWPAAAAAEQTGTWHVDAHRSEVRFTVTKLGFSDVTGVFRDFTGSVRFDPEHPENSSVQWTTRVASVSTGERDRDSSLQASEYFDAKAHPDLTFVSGRVRRLTPEALEVTGTICIRGVERPLTFVARPVTIDGRVGFQTDFELDRYDFNVRGGTVAGRLIGRIVRVRLVAVPSATTEPALRH
jgi:polyisoprenoid-binding protein YceI